MRSLIVVLLIANVSFTPVFGEEAGLQAGAAVVDVTPPFGQLIVGGWQPYPARVIHDPIQARCVVLEQDGTRMAFVVTDNVGIPAEVFDAARQLVPANSGINPLNIMMSSTHTHSATTARGRKRLGTNGTLTAYQQQVARGIADAVTKAVAKLQPAELAVGSATEPREVFNRRWFMAPGFAIPNPFGGVDKVRMNPPRGHGSLLRPAGPTDPEIAFMSIRTIDGKPLALFANYSLHYVGGVPQGDVSADYFAIFAAKVGQLLGADDTFVGVMSNGTSGNINNIDFQNKSARRPHYEKMTEVAHRVAERVFKAHDGLKYTRRLDHFDMGRQKLTLKARKPTPEILAYFKRVEQKPDSEKGYQSKEKIYAERMRVLQDEPAEVTIELQHFIIGDLAIVTIPFEVFVEIGLEIKRKSPFKQTFTISLANGSYGYLPTPEHHKLGGYETWLGTNVVEYQASVKITKAVLTSLNDSFAKKASK